MGREEKRWVHAKGSVRQRRRSGGGLWLVYEIDILRSDGGLAHELVSKEEVYPVVQVSGHVV